VRFRPSVLCMRFQNMFRKPQAIHFSTPIDCKTGMRRRERTSGPRKSTLHPDHPCCTYAHADGPLLQPPLKRLGGISAAGLRAWEGFAEEPVLSATLLL